MCIRDSSDETVCLLLIDFMNQFQLGVNHEQIAEKMKLSFEQVDELFESLQAKGYLEYTYDGKGIQFDISGIFHEETPAPLFQQNVFDLFEKEFSRPITQPEMQMMSEWLRMYESQVIIYALREALIQGKKNFSYINRILENWKAEGVTLQKLESGDVR